MVECTLNGGQELQDSLNEFKNLQIEHKSLLTAGKLKSLSDWVVRRQKVVNQLRACLDNFDYNSIVAGSNLAILIQKTFEVILGEEEALACLVKNRQEGIKKQLRTMRKGKAVLKGYSFNRGAGPKPKFLSSRT